MSFDPKYALERFRGMTREELVEEAALHADEYVPLVRKMLEGEVLARGIAPAELEARRSGAAAPSPEPALDYPALITSAMSKQDVQALAETLRRDGVPAVVREVDARQFHGLGCTVGRWGLFVPGPHAADAGRRLQALLPADAPGAAPSCGGCGGSCAGGDDEEAALEPGEWDEDGDWWKTGAPGEDDQ